IVHLPTTKCVSGETEIVCADGTVITIRELVEEQLRRADLVNLEADGTVHAGGTVSMFAMDSEGNVQPFEATRFARTRRGDRRVVKIVTRTGRRLTATTDHPVLAASGWTKLGDVGVGTRIAIARRLRVVGQAQPLPQTHARSPQ